MRTGVIIRINNMKRACCQRARGLILACAWVGFLGQISALAATFGVTPPSVSNTYSGVITLNMSSLTNGEQVIVQKYLDLNANGVIDSGEPLIDAFRINESGVSTI